MKKLDFRLILIAVMFVFIAGSMLGCGSSVAPATESSAQADTSKAPDTKDTVQSDSGIQTAVDELSVNGKKPDEVKGRILFWNWDVNEFEMMKTMNKIYPNVTFEFVNVAGDDYVMKLQTALASGGDVPDVLTMDVSALGKFFSLNVTEDIGSAPWSIDKNLMIPYLAEIATDKEGKLRAVPNVSCPGGFYYRRDIAKQYLGTDDPVEVGKKIADWDTFISTGKELVQKSGGKVFMISGVDALSDIFSRQNTKPWIEGNKLLIEENFLESYKLLETIRDANICANVDYSSPAYNATFAKGNVLGYFGAPWYQSYVLEANDKEGSGRWGIAKNPGGAYSFGGIFWGMYKDSKNKEAVTAYLKYELSAPGAKTKYELLKFLPPYAPAWKDTYLYQPSTWFGGQDITTYYLDIMNGMKVRKPEADDALFFKTFSFYVKALAKKQGGTAEELIKKVEDEVISKVPQYTK